MNKEIPVVVDSDGIIYRQCLLCQGAGCCDCEGGMAMFEEVNDG